MALIENCACGKDHEEMPRTLVYVEADGTEHYADMVCLEHKRHIPCRECLWRDSGATTTEEYVAWLGYRGCDVC